MFRKPLFWIGAVALASVFATLTWIYFPKAFPVVTVEITMDRQMAIERAEEIARTFGMGPDDYRIAELVELNFALESDMQALLKS